MAKLTAQGEAFIRKVVANGKNKLLENTDIKYTQKEYGENLIKWFNLYSITYKMDANIIAAQCYAESKFKAGAYNVVKTKNGTKRINAMGLTQFVLLTINEIFFVNRDKYFISDSDVKSIKGDIVLEDGKIPGSQRSTVLKNISNNPEVMIKAQYNYMYRIQKRNNGLAANALFIYNRGGIGQINKTYGEAVQKCKIDITEGINYVNSVFNYLSKYFGYEIDMTKVSPFA